MHRIALLVSINVKNNIPCSAIVKMDEKIIKATCHTANATRQLTSPARDSMAATGPLDNLFARYHLDFRFYAPIIA